MRDERGSATPLLAVLVLAVGGLCLGLGHLGGVANAAARARTAADAAALAAAAQDDGAAAALARANGGTLERLVHDGDDTEVDVRFGRFVATARARAERGSAGAASFAALAPELRDALDAAGRLLGRSVPVTSGWRSHAEQAALYRRRDTNGYPVAPPGSSLHEKGLAVDVVASFADRLAAIASEVGLCRPWPESDPVHFELCRTPG